MIVSILGVVSASSSSSSTPTTSISRWFPLIRQWDVSHVQVLVVRTSSAISPTAVVYVQATPTASIAAGKPRRRLVARVGHAVVVARVTTIEAVVVVVIVAVVMMVVVAIVPVQAISVGSRHRPARRHRSTVGHPMVEVGVHSRLLRALRRITTTTTTCFVDVPDNAVSV